MTENTIARIEGAKKKIETLNKKMERILAAKATGWDKNPYMYGEDDIRRTEKDIKEAENRLAYWIGKGEDEDAKAASRNVKPILEFLDGWKERVTQFYTKMFDDYYAAWESLRAEYRAMEALRHSDGYGAARTEYQKHQKAFNSKCRGYYKTEKIPSPYKYNKGKLIDHEVKVKDGEWETAMHYVSGNDKKTALEKLERELVAEYNSKYDSIVERASYYCGKIEDATGLRVGGKGELDGIVIGNKGTCVIETIGAGGYNIQCFHFRVLVHEFKAVESKKAPQQPEKVEKKSDKKVDWKAYSDLDLIKMCENLGIDIGHLISIEDSRIKRMRLVMAIKKFGMVGGEIAPAAFKEVIA